MFVHLHVHSDNSVLNGVMKVDKIVKKAKEMGMPAVALTDNGTLFPGVSFHAKCNGEGIKPIFGVQANLAPRTRFDKEPKTDEKTSELVLLAKNLTGYLNLIKIISKSHLEGFYYKPRVDFDLLKEFHEGIVLLSGGENGEITRSIFLGEAEKAKEIALKYKEVFGDDFYLEIQRTGAYHEAITGPKLQEISNELNIPLVATNNTYYEKQDDAEVREVLWCIDSGRLMSDPSRKKPETDQNYFKSPEEMEKLFEDLPEAIENTAKIADKVESFSIGFGKVQPQYPFIPEGETEESFLRKLVFDNAESKFGYFNQDLEDRLNYELKVIHDKGYDGYFLVIWSIVNWARSNDILVSTRGSAAGCAVSFAINITTLDPIRWGLFFERFLNPERKSLPDIDLDISDHGREALINWVKETYGHDNVTNIGALGKLTTKAAIRDVGRVLGIELNLIDKLSKLVPVTFGKVLGIQSCIADELAGKDIKIIEKHREEINQFREIVKDGGEKLEGIHFCANCQKTIFGGEKPEKCKSCEGEMKTIAEASPRFVKLLKYVSKIEGGIRNVSTHACGHLITTPNPVINFCPVQYETGSGKRIITEYEGKYLEDLGLMKFDFLGLANLSIIDHSIKFIKEFKNIDLDIYNVPLDDAPTYELLQRGDTTAVFQLESSGMKKYLKELRPENLEEISAMCALYRPGPLQFIPNYIDRKFGREKVEYLIPEIEDIMKISYGLPVYQEQILQIANKIAGYTLGEADNLRRAIGKKLPEVMAAEETKFKEGFLKNFPQYDKNIADQLWQYALPFADYGFNKAHSAVYAYVAYQTAYLKANYPTEFEAALMLSDIQNQDKLVRDILDAESRGIKILPPDINKSDAYFKIEEEKVIRFGIGGLKGVGLKAILSLVEERNNNGEFKSLDDLCMRIDNKSVPKGAIESLIKIGAMETFGKRSSLLQIYEDVYLRTQKQKLTAQSGYIDMFNDAGNGNAEEVITKLPNINEVDDSQKIIWEKEILGLPITPSLIIKITPYLEAKEYNLLHTIHENKKGDRVKIFAELSRKNVIKTKNDDEMCFLEVTDSFTKISVTIFPRTYEKLGEFDVGDFLSIKGKIQKRNGENQILADEVKVIKDYEVKTTLDKWNKSKDKKSKETKKKTSSGDKSGEFKAKEDSKEYKAEKAEQKPESNKDVNIFIRKGASLDQLKELNEKILSFKNGDDGCDVYLHLPNHETVRTIKLEGKFQSKIRNILDETIKEIK